MKKEMYVTGIDKMETFDFVMVYGNRMIEKLLCGNP